MFQETGNRGNRVSGSGLGDGRAACRCCCFPCIRVVKGEAADVDVLLASAFVIERLLPIGSAVAMSSRGEHRSAGDAGDADRRWEGVRKTKTKISGRSFEGVPRKLEKKSIKKRDLCKQKGRS